MNDPNRTTEPMVADAPALECGPFQPGDTFEKIEILELLGRGGSAFVYHGYQEFLDRHVAVKVIPVSASHDAEFRRRARAEATVLSRLRHPNVVRVHDAGVIDDGTMIYIVMEKLEGRTLREVMTALEYLNVPETLVIGAQVSDAVEAAHRVGAIHRDIKPENIFIEKGNHPRVLDFGITKFLDGSSGATTSKYRWQGTPLYMSPEQLQGKPVTVRSDIFALGTLLYEGLAGTHPCLNGITDPTFQEIGWIQIGNTPPLLTEVVPTIPDYVARVIQRAIQKAPEHRYGSMHEFGVALRDAERTFTLESRERRFAPALRDLLADTESRLQAGPPPGRRTPRIGSALSTQKNLFQLVQRAPEPEPEPAPPARLASQPPSGKGHTLRMPALSPSPPPASAAPSATAVPLSTSASSLDGTATSNRSQPPGPPHLPERPPSLRRVVPLAVGAGLAVAIPLGILIGLSMRRPAASAASPPPATVTAHEQPSASAAPQLAASAAAGDAAAPERTSQPGAHPGVVPLMPAPPKDTNTPPHSSAVPKPKPREQLPPSGL